MKHSYLTPLQARIYDRHCIDCRARNEAGVKQWRAARAARHALKGLVVVIRR